MSALNPLPHDKLVDAKGRPYFLWDVDMTLSEFRRQLDGDDQVTRAYLLGKLMRQARPDDVFSFVSAARIRREWDKLEQYLGHTRENWRWLLERWEDRGVA